MADSLHTHLQLRVRAEVPIAPAVRGGTPRLAPAGERAGGRDHLRAVIQKPCMTEILPTFSMRAGHLHADEGARLQLAAGFVIGQLLDSVPAARTLSSRPYNGSSSSSSAPIHPTRDECGRGKTADTDSAEGRIYMVRGRS